MEAGPGSLATLAGASSLHSHAANTQFFISGAQYLLGGGAGQSRRPRRSLCAFVSPCSTNLACWLRSTCARARSYSGPFPLSPALTHSRPYFNTIHVLVYARMHMYALHVCLIAIVCRMCWHVLGACTMEFAFTPGSGLLHALSAAQYWPAVPAYAPIWPRMGATIQGTFGKSSPYALLSLFASLCCWPLPGPWLLLCATMGTHT